MPCSPRWSAPRHGARRAASLPSRSTSSATVRAREQQPRLLEALADRGDVVVEAAAREAEAAARFVVVEAGARRRARARRSSRRCRPGKTQAPLLWSPRSARRDSSTSMPAAPSRTTTIVAAGRGGRSSAGAAAGAGNAEASTGAAGMARASEERLAEFGTVEEGRRTSERSDTRCDANPTRAQRFSLSVPPGARR